jgi:hypothetical protein
MDTNFYFETLIIYTLRQIIIKYNKRISIKGMVLSELKTSRFSRNFSNISALVSASGSFFHFKGQNNPELSLQRKRKLQNNL